MLKGFKWSFIASIVVLSLILSACVNRQAPVKDKQQSGTQSSSVSAPAEQAYPVTVTDVKGRTVTIDKKPERIVSLTPSNTEILFALGLGDKVVGVDAYSNYPEQTKDIKKVGDFNGPNIELITQLKPDLVVAGGYIQDDAIKKLEDMKITTISSEAAGLQQIYEMIELTGKVTGTQDKAEQLIQQLKDNIKAISDKTAGVDKPKVYFNVDLNGFFTAGKGTFISELIALAGGINVADDSDGYMQYSLEKIAQANPDIIITTQHAGTADDIKKIDALKNINAVKNDKIFTLDADLVNRPGPRVDKALEEMAKAIHPEVFK